MAAARKLQEYRKKRDFRKTAEPRGSAASKDGAALEFVIQKHAASHLHFDLRLEAGGVMKSWAVPKGPSVDPSVKRLAMEVEDHPIEYNTFEGTIPKGEYGGGTVMIWDRGSFHPAGWNAGEGEHEGKGVEAKGRGRGKGKGGKAALEKEILKGHRAGKLEIVFDGERMQGEYHLVRTRSESGKPQWLLFKAKDEYAKRGRDIVAEEDTSVVSGRTMEEIAEGKGGGRVWRSNRKGKKKAGAGAGTAGARARAEKVDVGKFSPMLASSAEAAPAGDGWTFEPKYDGIRVLAFATADAAALITRNGNDKSAQFPEVVDALRAHAAALEASFVVDGEIVPLTEGDVGRFEALQARMHVKSRSAIRNHARETPVALVAFDVLLDDSEALIAEPWHARRERLEALLDDTGTEHLQLGETTPDGAALLNRAASAGWEGIMAKRIDARYTVGRRSRDWLKIKTGGRQEFVVGGYTEPRNSRQHIGALLLGYFQDGELVYAGHTGSGFTQAGLREMYGKLSRLERKTTPFTKAPRTNEKAHWVTPRVVVEVKFNEWTKEGKLRQPVYLGIRDDKRAEEVVREVGGTETTATATTRAGTRAGARASKTATTRAGTRAGARASKTAKAPGPGPGPGLDTAGINITNPDKVFFPKEKITKGELVRYYVEMAEYVLPAMKDRPLVLKRYPNGIDGEAFYQQDPGKKWPDGVRVETIVNEDGEKQNRFVGGNLATLLHTIQLGAISYDPWHSRVGKLDFADYTILDLDPGEGATFSTVIRVARVVKEELERFGLDGALKTSGSRGLHVYVPLPARTPWNAATLVAQIIATKVAERMPKEATVVRAVKKRPRGSIYVDYLQNILGKTVAGVYAVRAKPGATVSAPLGWDELVDDLDPREFTIETMPARMRDTGNIWAEQMKRRNSLKQLLPRSGSRAAKRSK